MTMEESFLRRLQITCLSPLKCGIFPGDPIESAVPNAKGWLQEQISRPFNLYRGPLARASLAKLAAKEHYLCIVMHHAICDGWSLNTFFGELSALYDATLSGNQANLPQLGFQYADFAAWQQRRLTGGSLNDSLET